MGTVTCQEIINNARVLLSDNDPDGDFRETNDTLLKWIREGHSVIVILKPNANVLNQSIQLAPGTRQELPAGAVSLIRIVNNMGADGSTPGPVITIVDRNTLDSSDPNWHFAVANNNVEHYVFDDDDPTHFDVYPPQPNPAQQIRAVFASNPVLPTQIADTITLDDIYSPVLTDYVVYRAMSGDGLNPANKTVADAAYIRLTETLGVKRNIELAINPNQGVIN